MIPRFLKAVMAACCLIQGLATVAAVPSTPQEQASFLAGLPLPKSSTLAQLQKSAQYRQHQTTLQEEWAFCRRVRYETMQQWSRLYLGQDPASRGVLRYLFGGPDFLNAFAFFPEAKTIVLGGLEPVGEVPTPESLDPAVFPPALQALREALHTSLSCGYFITSEMKPQLLQGSFQGVLPVLYTELALTGNTLLSVTMISPFASPGVEILYRTPDGMTRTLYYFRADLSNGNECKRFLGWLGGLGPGASYLKAASYLLPLESFSQARDFLLKTSTLILQDDSGIPYRDISPKDWRIRLFGTYTDPLPIFHRHREPELVSAYASCGDIAALPFGAGYHVRSDDANLLLATRAKCPDMPLEPSPLEGASALPQRTPPRIRKALPVDIRKALPVNASSRQAVMKQFDHTPSVAIPQPASNPAPAAFSEPNAEPSLTAPHPESSSQTESPSDAVEEAVSSPPSNLPEYSHGQTD